MKARIIYHHTYRGYVTKTKSAIIDVKFIKDQGHTVVVEMLESVFGFPLGHHIAIDRQHIING